jgi:hypothetical protein
MKGERGIPSAQQFVITVVKRKVRDDPPSWDRRPDLVGNFCPGLFQRMRG